MKHKNKSMKAERSAKSDKAMAMGTPGFDLSQPNSATGGNGNNSTGGNGRNHHGTLDHAAAMALAASQPIVPNDSQFQDQAQLEADKRSVYKHPLFPLLALLFEKCELATQTTSDVPMSDSFHHDLEAFIQLQERDKKPFLSNDPEVDGLMIKAIQVLRIHLLELDKVQELCKDFCNRYITCLKGKMQSENLLRSDYYDGANGSVGGGAHLTSSHSNSPHNSYSSNGDASVSPPNNGVFHHHQQQQHISHPGHSGGGVSVVGAQNYHSNSTQPLPTNFSTNNAHQMSSSGSMSSSHMNTSPDHHTSSSNNSNHSSSASTALPLIHGGTPLSQIGIPQLGANSCLPSSSQDLFAQSPPTPSSEEEDDFTGRKKPKRGVLPKHATSIMRSWLFQHIVHPYPTEDEKRHIAGQTNLTLLQVNNWFINARRRILQPMLDASNPETTTTQKVKKVKSHSSKPALKYWSDNLANSFPSGQIDGMDPANDIGESSEESEESSNDNDGNDVNDLLIENSDSSQQ